MPNNNESYGIAVEVAIAKTFNIDINPDYEKRAKFDIVKHLVNNNIKEIFDKENIPKPQKHIAESQNPIDFLLIDNSSLSIKSNKRRLGKAAPQIVGQPTSQTYFNHLNHYINNFNLEEYLNKFSLPNNYENRALVFKEISLEKTPDIMRMYWENLFDCDYYLHFYNLAYKVNSLENYLVLRKSISPVWDKENFSFTQNLNSWNESNTVKYNKISIGEFQVHKNRDCFKFRFNIDGLLRLIKEGKLELKSL